MFYDFITADKSSKTPMYRQIYISVRNAVENGSLKKGTKLPSIRKLSESLGVSKTTVTSAYEQLCAEGYIKNKPQSGYYVEAEFSSKPKAFDTDEKRAKSSNVLYKYDFSGKSIDDKIINLAEWKKDIKDVINSNYLLTSYGDVQGEEALRIALQNYALGTRSVNTSCENIIVGAGIQPLLCLLCALLGCGKKVASANSSFIQSEIVFKSFDYNISYFESDNSGVTVRSLDKLKPDIIFINPNFNSTVGANTPVARRLEIIEWAKKNNALIIEDDYNGELRYSTHPMPCFQNYDTESTIYLGSFSKVLLPSVRISYMVLPEKLMKEYNKIKNSINQTASKTEQLALAKYINSGKIYVHLRKARRIYLEKSKTMLDCINRYFDEPEIIFNETALYTTVKLNHKIDRNKINELLRENSVCLMPYKTDNNEIGLSFSGIATEKIEAGIKLLSEIITNNSSC